MFMSLSELDKFNEMLCKLPQNSKQNDRVRYQEVDLTLMISPQVCISFSLIKIIYLESDYALGFSILYTSIVYTKFKRQCLGGKPGLAA